MDRGITVTEIAPMEKPVDASGETTAAIIGRALRGPLDTPVLVENFAGFRRRFGGVWHKSTLGPAVQQYFEHGGRKLYVVRVANSARGAMICLPARGGVIVLRALDPGSTETIRAAVDYDGIDDETRFNLIVQRVTPDAGLVLDQEIYRGLSCVASDETFIVDALQTSSLVRVRTPLPPGRPSVTTDADGDGESPYVGVAQKGSDGTALSDYDLVGSAMRGTGIFALNVVDRLDLLYLPPRGRGADIGPAAIVAAEQYCRKRGAMLIVDPPASWDSVSAAIEGVRESGHASANVMSYFPRVTSGDDGVPRAVGGAIAGLLCKLDRQQGPWNDLDQPGFGLQRHLRPLIELDVGDASALVHEGLNVIAGHTAGRATCCGSVTLGCSSQMERQYASLTVRRLCLMVTNAIERATRWAVFEADEKRVAQRIRAQVIGYMSALNSAGAFRDDHFVVQCDARLRPQPVDVDRGVNILLSFHPVGADEPVALSLHQTAGGCRVATTAFAPVAA